MDENNPPDHRPRNVLASYNRIDSQAMMTLFQRFSTGEARVVEGRPDIIGFLTS